MTMPDAVLAFKLLDNSNLSATERQLALTAAADLKFDTMKGALRRVFDNPTNDTGNSIEVQSAYYTSFKKKTNNTRYSADKRLKSTSKLNPLNKFGKPSRYIICQSTYHWKRDCPHKDEEAYPYQSESEGEECHVALFTKSASSAKDSFTVEAFGTQLGHSLF